MNESLGDHSEMLFSVYPYIDFFQSVYGRRFDNEFIESPRCCVFQGRPNF